LLPISTVLLFPPNEDGLSQIRTVAEHCESYDDFTTLLGILSTGVMYGGKVYDHMQGTPLYNADLGAFVLAMGERGAAAPTGDDFTPLLTPEERRAKFEVIRGEGNTADAAPDPEAV
jgi:hypothetical protein